MQEENAQVQSSSIAKLAEANALELSLMRKPKFVEIKRNGAKLDMKW